MKPRRDPERTILKHLLQACDLGGKRVLEIGSGEGEFTRQYARQARVVIGIDPAAEGVEAAAQKGHAGTRRQPNFLCGRGEHLPFDESSFDIALFALSL